MVRPSFPLTTERLLLRPFEEGDLDAVYAMDSHPDVARYLYWEPRTRDEARAALDRRVRMSTLDGEATALRLAVVRRDTGELIGDFSLGFPNRRDRQGEIGFLFHPDHQGHGYAAEAGAAVLGLGFETFGMHRIFGSCDARNTASARLMERLGMRLEGTLRETEFVKGEWCDELVYALLVEEWRNRLAASGAGAQ